MARAIEWAFRLLDRASAPAGAIDRALGRAERTMTRVERTSTALSSRMGSLGRAGEASAARVSRAWSRAGQTLGRVNVSGLQNQLVGLTAAAAPLLGAGFLGKSVLDQAGAREGALMSLGTLLKTRDQDQVRGAANWIDRFADITPFEDRDVMSSVRQLLAYKFSFGQTQGLARITGDAASALGNDPADSNEKWKIINRALGQIKAKGRLQGDELLQLQEAGVGTDEYLKAAFGPDYRKAQEKGQISSQAAIKAIVEGMDRDFGGAMERQATTLFGLASTLKSRPQRLAGRLFDEGGLDEAKRFMRNLVNLSDFDKEPGRTVLRRMVTSGKKLTDALFGTLADSTEGDRAAATVTRLMDGIDRATDWWVDNGPAIVANVRGFGTGLRAAGEGAAFLLRPLTWVVEQVDRLSGGSGEGVLGKVLGFGTGAFLLGRLGNLLTFGGLGALGARAGTLLLGGLRTAWTTIGGTLLTRGVLGELLTNPGGLLAGARAALAGLGGAGGLGTLVSTGLRAVPVIGWILTGATLLKGLGDQLYARWQPFADLMDRIGNSAIGRIFLERPEDATGFNRLLHFDVTRAARGLPQVWERPGSPLQSAGSVPLPPLQGQPSLPGGGLRWTPGGAAATDLPPLTGTPTLVTPGAVPLTTPRLTPEPGAGAPRASVTQHLTVQLPAGGATAEQIAAFEHAMRRSTLDAFGQLGLEGGYAAP